MKILVPKIHNSTHVMYEKWHQDYYNILRNNIHKLWISMYNSGIIVDYKGFEKDMMKTIYKHSYSKYKDFIFLGT